jgi:hypothetical protein
LAFLSVLSFLGLLGFFATVITSFWRTFAFKRRLSNLVPQEALRDQYA